MIKHEEFNIYSIALEMLSSDMKNLKHLQARYGMTKPQAINLISKLITEQEKKDEIIEGVKEILALNYSYQEIGVKISRLFKRIEEETK